MKEIIITLDDLTYAALELQHGDVEQAAQNEADNLGLSAKANAKKKITDFITNNGSTNAIPPLKNVNEVIQYAIDSGLFEVLKNAE
jgi:hypothetical protein